MLFVVSVSSFAEGIPPPDYGDYVEGTKCPKFDFNGIATVCGKVSSIANQKLKGMPSTYAPNVPLENITVAVYECDPDSSTSCLKSGGTNKFFSDTYTTEEGLFRLPMRMIGSKKIRYIAFFCGTDSLAKSIKVKSYRDIADLDVRVDCQSNSFKHPAPTRVSFINNNSMPLSCDMIGATQEKPNDTPLTKEVAFEKPIESVSTFYTKVEGFDPRFVPFLYEEVIPLPKLLLGEENFKGAYRKEDCEDHSSDTLEAAGFCDVGGANGANEYESRLYNDPMFLTSNFFAVIPPKDTMLAYREFSPRPSVNRYFQDDSMPARFIGTHFGNSFGRPTFRFNGQAKVDKPVSCEYFKQAKRQVNSNQTSRNAVSQNSTSSYGKMLSPPFVMKTICKTETPKKPANFDPLDSMYKPVCRSSEGEDIYIWDIHPEYDNCVDGQSGCDYKLTSDYWTEDLCFATSQRAATAKFPMFQYGENDSYYATGYMQAPFIPGQEARAVQKGAIAPVFSNGTEKSARQNSPVTAVSITRPYSSDSDLENVTPTAVVRYPYLSERDYRENIDSTGVRFVDMGTYNASYCLYSYVNEPRKTINQDNESSIFKTNGFAGNPDHYNELSNDEVNPAADSATIATTMTFHTSYSKRRNAALNGDDFVARVRADFLDGILNASSGTGRVTRLGADDVLNELISALFGAWGQGSTDGKTFGNRNVSGTLGSIDDLTVTYPLDSGNNIGSFYSVFKAPTAGFYPSNWGGSSSCNLANPTADCCYNWTTLEEGQECNTFVDEENVRVHTPGGGPNDFTEFDISSTCGVKACKGSIVGKITTWKCSQSCGTPGCTTYLDHDSIEVHNFSESPDCGDGKVTPNLKYDGVDYGEFFRAQCAHKQTTGSGDKITVSNDDDPNCYYEVVSCEDNGRDCEGSSLDASITPYCTVARAGPYGKTDPIRCAGSVEKDANMKVEAGKFVTDAGSENTLEPLYYSDNLPVLTFSPKVTANSASSVKRWDTTSYISTQTSMNTDPSGGSTIGIELPGATAGGTASGDNLMNIFAARTNFTQKPEYPARVDTHCSISNTLPGTTSLGGPWDCPIERVPEKIDVSKLSFDDTCKIKMSSECMAAVGALDLSPTFQAVLTVGATANNMPASVYLVYMSKIRTLNQKRGDRFSNLWSTGEDGMLASVSWDWFGSFSDLGRENNASCDDTKSNAQGPYDLIELWFKVGLTNGGAGKLDNISQGRSKTADRCNFLDATVVTGNMIAHGSGKTSCSEWDWASAKKQVLTMTYGANRLGDYATDPFFDDGGIGQTIFEACTQ